MTHWIETENEFGVSGSDVGMYVQRTNGNRDDLCLHDKGRP